MFLFSLEGGWWTIETSLTGSDASDYAEFGSSVSLDGDRALIGAARNSGEAVLAGAAYLFSQSGDSWTEVVRLTANDATDEMHFGSSVSLDGKYALVGANGSGAAYVIPGGPSIAVTPSPLAFGNTPVGAAIERNVTVSNDGLFMAATVTSSSSDGKLSMFPDTFTVAPGASEEVTVTFRPTEPGDYTADLVLSFEGSESPIILPVTATGTDAKIAFNSSLIPFPDMLAGEVASQALRIQNLGGEDLMVTEVSGGGEAFSVSEAAFVIPAGETHDLAVSFHPQEAGPFASEFIFTHSQATSPDTVDVRGFALGAEITLQEADITFPQTRVFETSSHTLYVSNPGSHD
ncbi:MAG TPA: choice-of-anchor D domain-containing protein, partial [Isosphaeraceae bacterium]|nr:choice-of-anchor D domain-containing protein [Isosphaeraceae bacterium]